MISKIKQRQWRKHNLCFEYEKVFGLKNSVGKEVLQDLINHFSYASGAFIDNDDSGRKTTYRLGQQSVINYIVAQLNTALVKSENENV